MVAPGLAYPVDVATSVVGRRIPLPVLLVPILVAWVAGLVADIVGPELIDSRPLVQIFLNPRNRYLVLAAVQVSAVSFFAVGFFRLVLTDPIAYVLGRQYGDRALTWAQNRSDDDGLFATTVLRYFAKAAPLVVLLAPNLWVCALAGASGMKPRVFVPLNVAGTLGRLTLFWFTAEAFKDQLFDLLDFIQRYQWPLIGLSAVVVLFQVRRAQSKGQLRGLTSLDAGAEADAVIEPTEDLPPVP